MYSVPSKIDIGIPSNQNNATESSLNNHIMIYNTIYVGICILEV